MKKSSTSKGKAYILRVSAQKGGVGKTTIAVNLAVAMKSHGYSVLLADADSSNPSVGLHLGLESVETGFIDLLHGKALNRVTVTHASSGLEVVCNPVSIKAFEMKKKEIENAYMALKGSNYDLLIVDTQPGYFHDVITRSIDETLIVTNPDMPSYLSALRLSEYFSNKNVPHTLVVNRVCGKKYEINIKEFEETYEGSISAVVPEDDIVPVSIAAKIPAYLIDPRNRFCKAIDKLSERIAASVGPPSSREEAHTDKTGKKHI